MTEKNKLVQAVQQLIPDGELNERELPIDDLLLTIPASTLLKVVHMLINDFGIAHLSTITGIDNGSEIEVLYHFWRQTGLTIRLILQYDDLQIDTLTELIPGALFYEREIAEMFGISIVGLDEAPLILPDSWCETPPLLRGEQ
jgi:NADH-quinone oxidoreductase subunit C